METKHLRLFTLLPAFLYVVIFLFPSITHSQRQPPPIIDLTLADEIKPDTSIEPDTPMGLHDAFMKATTYTSDESCLFKHEHHLFIRKKLIKGLFKCFINYPNSLTLIFLKSSMPTVFLHLTLEEQKELSKKLKHLLEQENAPQKILKALAQALIKSIKILEHFSTDAHIYFKKLIEQYDDDIQDNLFVFFKKNLFSSQYDLKFLIDHLASIVKLANSDNVPLSSNKQSETSSTTASTPPMPSQRKKKKDTKKQPKKYICQQCSRIYDGPNGLVNHEKIHQEGYRANFLCEKCMIPFKNQRNYSDHMNYKHGEQRFLCRFCKEEFQDRTKNWRHEQQCLANPNKLSEESDKSNEEPKKPIKKQKRNGLALLLE